MLNDVKLAKNLLVIAYRQISNMTKLLGRKGKEIMRICNRNFSINNTQSYNKYRSNNFVYSCC